MPGQFIDDAEPQFIDDAEGSSTPLMMVTPEQRLAEKLGFKYPRLKQSPTFREGDIQRAYELSKDLQSNLPVLKQIQSITRGATAPGRKLEQLYYYLKNKTGISNEPQYEYEKAKLAAEEAGYQSVDRPKLPVIGDPFELAGSMGSLPNPSSGGLGSLRTVAGLKASAPVLGKTALIGSGMAASQPVENTAEQDFLQQTGRQAGMGAIVAPLAQIGVEKAVSPAAAKLMKLLGGKPKMDVRNLQKDLTRAGEDQGDIVQSELQRQYDEDRAKYGKPFQELRSIQVTSNPMNPAKELVPLEGYKSALNEAIEEVSTSGARLDPKAMTILKGYQEGIAKAKTTDWNRALNISKKLNEDIADAYNGPEPNRELGRQLEHVKRKLNDDLDKAGEQFGDLYKKAKAGWAENVGKKWEDPTEGGRILYKARTSPVPDETISALIKTKSPDRASIYYSRLSPKGQNAVKSYALDDLMKKSTNANGKFDPKEFIQLYNDRKTVIDVFFHGDDKVRLDGLYKLMRYATMAGSGTGAGVGMLATTPLIGTSPIMKLSPAGGAWAGNRWLAGPFRSGFAKLFQTAPMQKLLLEASNLPVDSPKLNALLSQIPKMTGVKEGQSDSDKLKKLLGGE